MLDPMTEIGHPMDAVRRLANNSPRTSCGILKCGIGAVDECDCGRIRGTRSYEVRVLSHNRNEIMGGRDWTNRQQRVSVSEG
jgi:hypothetical protein